MHRKGIVEHISVVVWFGGFFKPSNESRKLFGLIAIVSPKILPTLGLFDCVGQSVGRSKAHGKRQQVVRAFAILASELERRHAGRVAHERQIDQLVHCLKIKSGFFGLRIERQVASINSRKWSVDPLLCFGQFDFCIANRIEVLLQDLLVVAR